MNDLKNSSLKQQNENTQINEKESNSNTQKRKYSERSKKL
jgi:hypothetical protein